MTYRQTNKTETNSMLQYDGYFLRLIKRLSLAAGWALSVVCTLLFFISVIFPGFFAVVLHPITTMKTNTMVLFVAGASALLAIHYRSKYPVLRRYQILLGIVLLLLSGVTLAEYITKSTHYFTLTAYISGSESAFKFLNERMSFNTGFAFFLMGLSVLLKSRESKTRIILYQIFIIAIAVVSWAGLMGYIYERPELLQLMDSSAMTPDTAVALFVLSIGFFNAAPEGGIMKRVGRNSMGGRMIRYFVPAILLSPVVIELVIRGLVGPGYVSKEYHQIIHSLTIIVFFIGFVWFVFYKFEEMEAKTFHSSQLLEVILNSVPQKIYWKDKNLRYMGCNNQFADGLGIQDPDEIIGKDDLTFYPGKTAEEIRSEDEAILSSKKPVFHPGRAEVQSDGTVIWKRESKTPFYDVNMNVMGILGAYEDISGTKAAQLKYETIINTSIDGFWISDTGGKFLDVNDAFCMMTGYSEDEILDMRVNDLEPAASTIKFSDRLAAIPENGQDKFETVFITKSGKEKEFSLTINFQSGISGDQIYVFARNITEEKQEERRIRLSEERYRTLTESSSDYIYIINSNGAVDFANKALLRQLDKSKEDVIGRNYEQVFSGSIFTNAFNTIPEVLKTSKPYIGVEQIEGKDSTTWLNTRLHPIFDTDGTPVQVLGNSRDITEQKTDEEDLRETKDFLENLITKANAPIIVWDSDWNITRVNNAFEQISGYHAAELLGKNIMMIFPKEEIERKYRLIEDLKQGGQLISSEIQILSKSGSLKTVLWNSANIYDNDGTSVIASIAQGTDITERLEAEEERNRFFKLSLDYMCVAGMDGYLKRVNPSFMRTFGYTEEEFLSRPFFDFIHPDDIKKTYEVMTELNQKNAISNFLNRYRCIDGSYRWLHWASVLYGDRIYSAAHDITDLKKTEIQLRESGEKLQIAHEASEAGVWEWIIEKDQLIWDDRMFKIFGVSKEKFEHKAASFLNSIHPTDVVDTKAAMENSVKTKENFDRVYRVIRSDNSHRYISAKGKLFSDEFGNVEKMIGICIDITDQKAAEAQLRTAILNLEHSNKELEQFAYVASHDLQEPLRMVSSFTQLLEKRYKDQLDQDANDFIRYAVDGANRMHKLISDLLDYSRITTRGKETGRVNLNEIFSSAVANLYHRIHERGALVTKDILPECIGNEMQLTRVIQNLIDNAIKFCKSEIPLVHISSELHEDGIKISVADNGIGIKEEYKDKVFIIFQRLHGAGEYPGTGIGLAICRRIVERHNGKIWFESIPGQGTTFYFTLQTSVNYGQ